MKHIFPNSSIYRFWLFWAKYFRNFSSAKRNYFCSYFQQTFILCVPTSIKNPADSICKGNNVVYRSNQPDPLPGMAYEEGLQGGNNYIRVSMGTHFHHPPGRGFSLRWILIAFIRITSRKTTSSSASLPLHSLLNLVSLVSAVVHYYDLKVCLFVKS